MKATHIKIRKSKFFVKKIKSRESVLKRKLKDTRERQLKFQEIEKVEPPEREERKEKREASKNHQRIINAIERHCGSALLLLPSLSLTKKRTTTIKSYCHS